MPYNVTSTAALPEYAGLEDALTQNAARQYQQFLMPQLRAQFGASGLGNSGVFMGALGRATGEQQAGLAEQLAQLRVQRAMAQLEQRRFADQLGFQDYQNTANQAWQGTQNQLARDWQAEQARIQNQWNIDAFNRQRDWESEQQRNSFLGSLLGSGASFLTGGLAGLAAKGITGGRLGGFLTGGFAGPGAIAGAAMQQRGWQNVFSQYPNLYNAATTPRSSLFDLYHPGSPR